MGLGPMSDYHARVQPAATNEQTIEAQRKQRFRRVVVFLLLAIVLLLLGVLLLAMATPEWQADGSRPPYSVVMRVAICACLIGGTMLVPVSVRELILALLGQYAMGSALGVILGVMVGMIGLIAVPVEVWLVSIVTDELEPGAQQRYEDGEDWDWDD
jgi:hypothetical protein